jgi:hypothetical protein
MKSNKAVIDAFQSRKPARNRNLSSDGESLLSYHWWKVARWVDGHLLVRAGTSYSISTNRHYPNWQHTRSSIETPREQARMNVGYARIYGDDGPTCYWQPNRKRIRSDYKRVAICEGCKASLGWVW